FRNSTFSLLLVISITGVAIAIVMVNYLALFLQTTTGLSPSSAGLLFILLTGGLVCGSRSGVDLRHQRKGGGAAGEACDG
ncbi:MFS transporter, partial [Rhizobium ruizarguesonis]